MKYLNPVILNRFDELISEGESLNRDYEKTPNRPLDQARLTQWATSSLNLLDKLSVSTNRFVTEFERYGRANANGIFYVGAPLGVLRSARNEYEKGLAIEYHLSVSAIVYCGLLDEASHLFSKGHLRAAAVLLGAALEEGLKNRARAIPIEIGTKETLSPVILKLKTPEVGLISEFEAKRLEAIAKLRNDAAHGGEFEYSKDQVKGAIDEVEAVLRKLLG